MLYLSFLAVLVACLNAEEEADIKPTYDATLYTACDDYGSMFRSDNGGKTVTNIVTESEQNKWYQTYTYPLKDVTKNTIIKIRCRNGGGPGGFIAAMEVDGSTYVTTNPITAGNWKAYRPYLKSVGKTVDSLTYTNQGTTWSAGVTGPIDPSAVYTNVPPSSSLEFYFRFRTALRRKEGYRREGGPCEDIEDEDELKAQGCLDADVEEEEYLEIVPFDPQTEAQAMREAGVSEEEILAVCLPSEEVFAMEDIEVVNSQQSSRLHDAMYVTGASLIALTAGALVYKCKSHMQKGEDSKPLASQATYQSV